MANCAEAKDVCQDSKMGSLVRQHCPMTCAVCTVSQTSEPTAAPTRRLIYLRAPYPYWLTVCSTNTWTISRGGRRSNFLDHS